MKKLYTGSLTLEPQTRTHAEEMFDVLSDPAIYAFENEPPPSKLWLTERFAKLESRYSADGTEHWLNWVIRLPTGELAGYVQATLTDNAEADIAYVLASSFWGQGIARAAVATMLVELSAEYGTRVAFATLKANNHRSLKLLKHLGFVSANALQCCNHPIEADESLMYKGLDGSFSNALNTIGYAIMPTHPTPESLIQRQLDAYNAHDLHALMATYAEDAQQFEHPATLIASGTEAIRARMAIRLQEPNLHARLIQRAVMGNVVIDHEEVTRTFPEGPGRIEMVAIYQVSAGKIKSASIILGEKILEAKP